MFIYKTLVRLECCNLCPFVKPDLEKDAFNDSMGRNKQNPPWSKLEVPKLDAFNANGMNTKERYNG